MTSIDKKRSKMREPIDHQKDNSPIQFKILKHTKKIAGK